MRRTYRHRIYPTRRHAVALEAQLRQACDLYNAALEHRRRMWRDHGATVSYGDQSAELRGLRAAGLLGAEANFWSQQGELIAGPRAERASARAVRRAQRRGARRKRGSSRRHKATALLARQREREASRRRDHARKTAPSMVERFDLIAVEDLNCRGLAKGMLARDCNDPGWAAFTACLRDKAEEAGRRVVLVDARNTSQTCSACGAVVPKALGVRVHSYACSYTADRDVNAARNVLARAGGCPVQAPTVGAEVRAVA